MVMYVCMHYELNEVSFTIIYDCDTCSNNYHSLCVGAQIDQRSIEYMDVTMPSTLVTVATCSLNQWALDFDGNLERIIESIQRAKNKGATLRVGPELEICGYGCEDHFLEQDTFYHCWESLGRILLSDITDDIICDIGMPVLHANVRYNCRVFCLNRKILCIRPKLFMADDGNYRETRWFKSWKQSILDQYVLPVSIQEVTGQHRVPFGIFTISTLDAVCASETCEELFTPDSPHIALGFAGVEIIGNGSGSHHQLRKLNKRIDLITSATSKNGGVYLYANQQGCDGGRLYFDGCALVVVNGSIVAQGSQFSVEDVEVITAVVDLEDVRSYRGACSSRSEQASYNSSKIPRVHVEFYLARQNNRRIYPSSTISPIYHSLEEEIAMGPACWLWDYLRRSGASGFFLPLSGGADSSAVACIVGIMCRMATDAANSGNTQVMIDIQRITGKTNQVYKIMTPFELANHIFHTAYMGSANSSVSTQTRAELLAKEIGAYHLTVNIDNITAAILNCFVMITGKLPRYSLSGGSNAEDLALQNIQARTRMVLSYLFAQLLPWVRSRSGFLLVLGSANVDEALRGYMTKYDCSSADVNPIGAVSKGDLKKLLFWAGNKYYPSLLDIVKATPTAELRPTHRDEMSDEHAQRDEDDMGMTYEELGIFGRLRKVQRCGPLWMFQKLCSIWNQLKPTIVAEKVQRFFYFYSANRHKMTTLTPSYHAEEYSPDDNRFDMRPFLYNTKWSRQFASINNLAKDMESEHNP